MDTVICNLPVGSVAREDPAFGIINRMFRHGTTRKITIRLLHALSPQLPFLVDTVRRMSPVGWRAANLQGRPAPSTASSDWYGSRMSAFTEFKIYTDVYITNLRPNVIRSSGFRATINSAAVHQARARCFRVPPPGKPPGGSPRDRAPAPAVAQ